ncbi:hypothetical protein A4S06_05250 [Erysipelotrichaceae bacterium MTC7]|nr:hypothetical protein A4S06_05250 [Erysipelotrichaceae bacterium MTC7]
MKTVNFNCNCLSIQETGYSENVEINFDGEAPIEYTLEQIELLKSFYEDIKLINQISEYIEDLLLDATQKGYETGYHLEMKVTGRRTVNNENAVIEWFDSQGINKNELYCKKMKTISELKELSKMTYKEFYEVFENSIYVKNEIVKEVLVKDEGEN